MSAARLLYVDAIAGVAGDMLLGALLDAGAPLDDVRAGLRGLDFDGLDVDVEPVERHGLAAACVRVVAPDEHVHRDWAAVRGLLDAAGLLPRASAGAHEVFRRLADAEGRVHRIAPDHVRFHEVGAIDALAGRVRRGARARGPRRRPGRLLAAPDRPRPHQGRARRPAAARPGHARAAARRAAARRRRRRGARHPPPGPRSSPRSPKIDSDRSRRWRSRPSATAPARATCPSGPSGPRAARHRCRGREGRRSPGRRARGVHARRPLGRARGRRRGRVPRGRGARRLGRPRPDEEEPARGILTAVARPEHERRVAEAMLRHTTTLGVRTLPVLRWELDRELHTVWIDGQPAAVKVGRLDGEVINLAPEHEDVARAAAALGRPAKAVWAQAWAAAQREIGESRRP